MSVSLKIKQQNDSRLKETSDKTRKCNACFLIELKILKN